jgi:hypothetical protein
MNITKLLESQVTPDALFCIGHERIGQPVEEPLSAAAKGLISCSDIKRKQKGLSQALYSRIPKAYPLSGRSYHRNSQDHLSQ